MPVIWKPRRKKTKAGLPENYHDKKNGVSNLWSEKNKREALYLYLASGNMTEVSQLLNIPYVTLKWWKSSDWWQQELEKIRDEEQIQLSGKTKKLIDKAFEQLGDRLDKGNYRFNSKTNEMQRIPVSARDLSNIADKMLEKRQMLNKQPVQYKDDKVALVNKLEKLAKTFEDFSRGKTGRIIEAEVVREEANAEQHEYELQNSKVDTQPLPNP